MSAITGHKVGDLSCSLLIVLTEVLQSWRVQFDSPISTVLLFQLSCRTPEPSGERSMSPFCWSLLLVWSVMIVGRFSGLGEDMEGYNLLITSTVEMAVVYRLCCTKSERFPLKPVHLPERAELIWCYLCLCSEISRTVACPGLHVSQTAISQTLFCVRWSSTWTSTDKRRCC